MHEWILYVMSWAAQLSGYPIPDTLPEVQWKSESWFSHRACEDHLPCPIFGLYEDADVVFLREDLTDSAKDHVAVHEFVHYLQHRGGRVRPRGVALDSDKREQGSLPRAEPLRLAEIQNGFSKFLPGNHTWLTKPERPSH
jgi:hypothetical protein